MANADLTSKREGRQPAGGGFAEAAPHPLLSLLRRLAGRVLAVVTTLLGLLFLTFSMGRLLPADLVLAITGAEVSKEVYDRVYNELGLGQPIWMQFLSYVGKIATGDLGLSAT
ncbi:ABC transporter permease, partial [Rhizobium phaseoli]